MNKPEIICRDILDKGHGEKTTILRLIEVCNMTKDEAEKYIKIRQHD